MEERQREKLAAIFGDNLRFKCETAQYTSFRTGGEADAVCFPKDQEQLRKAVLLMNSENIPFYVMGRGSNLLISDKGFRGVVIILKGDFETISQDKEDRLMVTVWSGVHNNETLFFCRKNGLSGLEFLAGIPGTMGGAIVMNAGAFGHEIGKKLHDMETITKHGEIIKRERKQLRFEYRRTNIPEGEIILKARFKLYGESSEIVDQRISEYIRTRKEHQPIGLPSAGSVFKNPPNDFAGRLIEEVGLKGKRIGGAMISPKHANFIVNAGEASSDDILALMALAKEKVRDKTGINLELEIKILGN